MSHKTCTTVTLLKRPIKNGRLSLYLDYYPEVRNPETMKLTRREYLGIYIYARPKTKAKKEFNEDMMQKAEAIRNLRFNSLLNEQFGFFDHDKLQGDFLGWFEKIASKKRDKVMSAYLHFNNFVHGKCRFIDVNQTLCEKFATYLLEEAKGLRHGKERLSRNSASAFYCAFRSVLKKANKAKLLRENVNDYLESIPTEDVEKEFLTLDEVKKLVATPCKYDVLKRASLFSCLTGLRISDIENLKWENICEASEGGLCMHIRTQKTKTVAVLPISDEAVELCGERSEGKIFKGFRRSMANKPLKDWLKDAGITKQFSFHGFRHTYATLQISAGTDIYTVSKMLTHRSVQTTQIYAALVSEKKRETVGRISLK